MAKKYRLKKKYPGLPDGYEKGTKIRLHPVKEKYFPYNGRAGVPAEDVENSPEYWEKIKDYRIVKIQSPSGAILTYNKKGECIHRDDSVSTDSTISLEASIRKGDTIYAVKRLSDGYTFSLGDYITTNTFNDPRPISNIYINSAGYVRLKQSSEILPYAGSTMLERAQLIVDNTFKVLEIEKGHATGDILKVKRKSDGEIFEVGDKVKWDWKAQIDYVTIDSFFIEDGRLRFTIEPEQNKDSLSFRRLSKLRDLTCVTKPVFVSENGIPMYKGDTYHYLDPENCEIASDAVTSASGNVSCLKYFATKEKAEKWVKRNEKKYSEGDLEKAWYEARMASHPTGDYINFNRFIEELN